MLDVAREAVLVLGEVADALEHLVRETLEMMNAGARLNDIVHSVSVDPAVLDVPRLDDAFRDQQDEQPWRVDVKSRGRVSSIHYPWNPLDAVGWKGTLAPLRLNWRDTFRW